MHNRYHRPLHAPSKRRALAGMAFQQPRFISALILVSLLLTTATIYRWRDAHSQKAVSRLRPRTRVLLISGHFGTMVDFKAVGTELGMHVTESRWLSKTLSISQEEALEIWDRCEAAKGVGLRCGTL